VEAVIDHPRSIVPTGRSNLGDPGTRRVAYTGAADWVRSWYLSEQVGINS
jgi:hypothetical protein